jgi:transcriptional regulator
MYSPSHFEETRIDVMHELMRQYPLATVIASTPAGLVADHIPLQVVLTDEKKGKLIGHVARANPLWQIDPETELLIVFQGAQCYISPNWYASKSSSGGKVVPTWNYAVVHVRGKLKALQEAHEILPILNALTQRHESNQAHPWSVNDAPPGYIEKLLGAIVGFEIDITHMQGKWKVSQNRSVEDRASTSTALMQLADTDARVIAKLIPD